MTSQPVSRPDLEWTFGDRIRKIRRAVGVSQIEFAEVIGQGAKSVGAWELGTNAPRDVVAIAKRIRLAYGIPEEWTLGLETRKAPEPDRPGGAEVTRSVASPEPIGSVIRLATRQLAHDTLAA